MSDEPEPMTEPIAPDNTAALVEIVQRVTRFDGCIPATIAIAIAEAVCPDDCVVVRRDDLRAALDEFGWRELHFASHGFQAIYDRLKATLEGQE